MMSIQHFISHSYCHTECKGRRNECKIHIEMQKRSLQSFLLVYFMKLIFEKEVYYAIGNERENNEL